MGHTAPNIDLMIARKIYHKQCPTVLDTYSTEAHKSCMPCIFLQVPGRSTCKNRNRRATDSTCGLAYRTRTHTKRMKQKKEIETSCIMAMKLDHCGQGIPRSNQSNVNPPWFESPFRRRATRILSVTGVDKMRGHGDSKKSRQTNFIIRQVVLQFDVPMVFTASFFVNRGPI